MRWAHQHAGSVERVDAAQARDGVEGLIGGEDCVDAVGDAGRGVQAVVGTDRGVRHREGVAECLVGYGQQGCEDAVGALGEALEHAEPEACGEWVC